MTLQACALRSERVIVRDCATLHIGDARACVFITAVPVTKLFAWVGYLICTETAIDLDVCSQFRAAST